MRSILYICLIVIGIQQSVLSLSPTYGVGPEELEYYKENKFFNCLRSNIQIPFSQVNDDFCDCPDGTDEPGTSACSSLGRFYCKNIGHKGNYIISSFVNDGVCDCCDGSDEYNGKITCINNCKEIGAESRKQQNQLIESYENGLKKKKEMEDEGTQIFNEKSEEIIRLRKEIDPITQEIKELEVLIEQKKSERDNEKKRLQDERQLKKQKEKESLPQPPVNAEKQAEQLKEGEQATTTTTAVQDSIVETDKVETEGQEEEEEGTSEFLEDVKGLESELSRKRESLKGKESEIEKIEKMLKSDLGVNNVFLPLYNKCFDLQTKEYTYTICPYEKASQGHTSLGKFNEFKNNGKAMLFDDGQQCWGGPKRSIMVEMECGHDNELYDVNEPGKCEYTIKFKTPALCNEEHLKILRLEGDHNL